MKDYFLLFCVFISINVSAQEKGIKIQDISQYFKEVEKAGEKSQFLWNKNLYGSIMLIDPETRQIYTNRQDSLQELEPKGNIYAGLFPQNKHIANTSMHWNGRNWATIMLPLPKNKYDRVGLICHELFHVIQPELGFIASNGKCDHLDSKEGRIYLRLELEALKRTINENVQSEVTKHLTNAFIFRKYRQYLFHNSAIEENLLELNEGIAEYTGEKSSGRPNKEKAKHFTERIDLFMQNPTFVRSFAYQTIPVYGYLLDKKQQGWNKNIDMNTNLTMYFIEALHIDIPDNLNDAIIQIKDLYGGGIIETEEVEREKEIKKQIAEYKYKFIEQPHFEISFEKMQISFDPRNIMPLEENGTIYPNINIIDQWGVLDVTNGALMSPNWKKITITNPTNMDGNMLSGDGWKLKLNEGYSIIITDGNFSLRKE